MREPEGSFGKKNLKKCPGFSDCGALHDNGLRNSQIHPARACKDTVNPRGWEALKEAKVAWRGATRPKPLTSNVDKKT